MTQAKAAVFNMKTLTRLSIILAFAIFALTLHTAHAKDKKFIKHTIELQNKTNIDIFYRFNSSIANITWKLKPQDSDTYRIFTKESNDPTEIMVSKCKHGKKCFDLGINRTKSSACPTGGKGFIYLYKTQSIGFSLKNNKIHCTVTCMPGEKCGQDQ